LNWWKGGGVVGWGGGVSGGEDMEKGKETILGGASPLLKRRGPGGGRSGREV